MLHAMNEAFATAKALAAPAQVFAEASAGTQSIEKPMRKYVADVAARSTVLHQTATRDALSIGSDTQIALDKGFNNETLWRLHRRLVVFSELLTAQIDSMRNYINATEIDIEQRAARIAGLSSGHRRFLRKMNREFIAALRLREDALHVLHDVADEAVEKLAERLYAQGWDGKPVRISANDREYTAAEGTEILSRISAPEGAALAWAREEARKAKLI